MPGEPVDVSLELVDVTLRVTCSRCGKFLAQASAFSLEDAIEAGAGIPPKESPLDCPACGITEVDFKPMEVKARMKRKG